MDNFKILYDSWVLFYYFRKFAPSQLFALVRKKYFVDRSRPPKLLWGSVATANFCSPCWTSIPTALISLHGLTVFILFLTLIFYISKASRSALVCYSWQLMEKIFYITVTPRKYYECIVKINSVVVIYFHLNKKL